MRLLIDSRVNVNQSVLLDHYMYFPERTPLQAACEIGYVEGVELLLGSGADVNSPARHGSTALQFAVIGGHIGTAVLLIERGAHINAPGSKLNGRTALEGAAEHGRIDMLQLLINAGACNNGRDNQYLRSIRLAAMKGHLAVKNLLESLFDRQGVDPMGPLS
jgi:ankyrin repeat protein